MANVSDHRLVTELVELVQFGDDARAGKMAKDRAPAAPRRRILDIVLWSSLTNIVLLGCFVVGWNFDVIKGRFMGVHTASAAVAAGKSDDPLALSRYELQDNELLTHGPQRQLKGPLQITLVPSSAPSAEVAQPAAVAAADAATPGQEQGDGSGDIVVGPEDPSAQRSKNPVLRKGDKAGDVEIGSFETVSLPGSSSECLDTAYGLLDDVGAPRDKLKVLAESKAITVARICAGNGSLVVTCRLDQITISPRRLKPNETCTG